MNFIQSYRVVVCFWHFWQSSVAHAETLQECLYSMLFKTMLTVAGLLKIMNLLHFSQICFPVIYLGLTNPGSFESTWLNTKKISAFLSIDHLEDLINPCIFAAIDTSCAACWFMISSRKQLRRFMVTHVYWNRRSTNRKVTTKTKTWAFVSQVFMLSVYITFCLSFIPAGITHYLVKELGWTLKKPVLYRCESWFSSGKGPIMAQRCCSSGVSACLWFIASNHGLPSIYIYIYMI